MLCQQAQRFSLRYRVDVVPELAMLQSFSSGPTFREVLKRKTPPGLRRRGFGIVCCSSPYGALPTTTTTRTTTTAADGAVGSSFALSMEVVIGDLVGFVFNNIYTSTALQGRQWKIFQQGKIEGLITFCTELQITKNPAGARFRQSPAAGNRKAHCIMSTLKVYVFRAERAISARILTYLVHS